MNNVNFKPWVGKNYEQGGILGKKVMALGESHYWGEDYDEPQEKGENENFITQIVDLYLTDYANCGNWKKTYFKFEEAIKGSRTTQEDSIKIWNSIIFYNYLQFPVNKPRQTDIPEDLFKESVIPFFEVLEKYRPEYIIVWGKQLWEKLPWDNWEKGDNIESNNLSTKTGFYVLKDGFKIKVMAINHPSTAFSWDKWHPLIKEFIGY